MSSLDEERQCFKARVGLEVQETAGKYAFCHHTMLSAWGHAGCRNSPQLVVREYPEAAKSVDDASGNVGALGPYRSRGVCFS